MLEKSARNASSSPVSEKKTPPKHSAPVSEKKTPPKHYNEKDLPVSMSKSSVSVRGKKTVAKKSVSGGADTTSVPPSPQRKMFAGAGGIEIQANASKGLFAGIALEDGDDEEMEEEVVAVTDVDVGTPKLVGNQTVLTNESSSAAIPSPKLRETRPVRSTIQQDYASYQSGSLHRRFVNIPNFFVMPDVASPSAGAVKAFREQLNIVKLREREDAVETNRAVMGKNEPLSRFGRSSVTELFPIIARSLTSSSSRIPLTAT